MEETLEFRLYNLAQCFGWYLHQQKIPCWPRRFTTGFQSIIVCGFHTSSGMSKESDLWNSLPPDLGGATLLPPLSNPKLKTHLFKITLRYFILFNFTCTISKGASK